MALSRVIKTGNGSTNQFVVDFATGYLSQSDITCRVGEEVDGSGAPAYRTITFLSESLMQISGPIPAAGARVVFERTVEKEDTLIHFTNGDVLDEENLDISFKQILMIVHEVLDSRFGVFNNDLDLGGFQIKNLGDPTEINDAANKAYVDSRISTGQDSANAAAASAAAAAASASSASTSNSQAQQARIDAQAARDVSEAAAASTAGSVVAAANSASAASGYASAASGSATSAGSSATSAAASATQAGNSETAAAGSATNAAGSATAASGSASAASGSASAAAGSASSASGSAATATTQATQATTARDFSWQWAQQAEDVSVNDGTHTGFSAYHWALKAQLGGGDKVSSWAGLTGEVTLTQAVDALKTSASFVQRAGDTMLGRLTGVQPVSDGVASFNFPPGVTPPAGNLINGDMWMVGVGLVMRRSNANYIVHDTGNLSQMSVSEAQSGTANTQRVLTASTLKAGVRANTDPWLAKVIGEFVFFDDGTGLPPPPTDQEYRYLKLTWDDPYNSGILTDMQTTGVTPDAVITAVVNLVGTPLHGKRINLLNDEGRFLAASPNAGSLVNSRNRAHTHVLSIDQGGAHTHVMPLGTVNGAAYRVANAGAITVNNFVTDVLTQQGGTHLHTGTAQSDGGINAIPKTMGVTVYRRIA